MGTFSTSCRIEHILNRTRGFELAKALVDTGSEFTWAPSELLESVGIKREKKDMPFTMANGVQITRSVGFAIIRVGEHFTVDEVVFAEPGDMSLLGARTLEGLNLMVDSGRKRLVAAGPLKAAGGKKRAAKKTRKKQ